MKSKSTLRTVGGVLGNKLEVGNRFVRCVLVLSKIEPNEHVSVCLPAHECACSNATNSGRARRLTEIRWIPCKRVLRHAKRFFMILIVDLQRESS